MEVANAQACLEKGRLRDDMGSPSWNVITAVGHAADL
jgi:hypothetical protein